MSTGPRRDAAVCALLGALSLPVLFFGLGDYSAVHMDELLYHGVARQMWESRDFFRVEFAGELRSYDALMNAPLHYWVKAALIAVMGDGRWSMRILSAVFGLATVCLTALAVGRLATRRAGLLAGLLLLTTFQFVHLHGARTGEMETLVSFVFLATALLFASAVAGQRGFWGHHLCLVALAHLKLPLVLLPVAAELAYFALTPAARSRLRPWLRTGVLVLPLLLVWRVVVILQQPEAATDVASMMWSQAAGDAPKVARDHAGPLGNAWFYLRVFVFGAFPAVMLYPLGVIGVIRDETSARARDTWRIFALNVAAILVFFLFVSKHYPWYVTPTHAFFCAFVAVWLDRLPRQQLSRAGLAALVVVLAVALWLRFPGLGYDPFSAVARTLPLIEWARIGPVAAWLGVPLTALLAAAWMRRLPIRPLVAAVTGLLLLIGAARVLAPLQFLGYESEIEKLRAEVDRARAAGEELSNPLLYTREPNEWGLTRVWYFFGDEYWVVAQQRVDGKRSRVVALYDRSLPRPPGVGEEH